MISEPVRSFLKTVVELFGLQAVFVHLAGVINLPRQRSFIILTVPLPIYGEP